MTYYIDKCGEVPAFDVSIKQLGEDRIKHSRPYVEQLDPGPTLRSRTEIMSSSFL